MRAVAGSMKSRSGAISHSTTATSRHSRRESRRLAPVSNLFARPDNDRPVALGPDLAAVTPPRIPRVVRATRGVPPAMSSGVERSLWAAPNQRRVERSTLVPRMGATTDIRLRWVLADPARERAVDASRGRPSTPRRQGSGVLPRRQGARARKGHRRTSAAASSSLRGRSYSDGRPWVYSLGGSRRRRMRWRSTGQRCAPRGQPILVRRQSVHSCSRRGRHAWG